MGIKRLERLYYKMYDPMYNVKFCKLGMKHVKEVMEAAFINEVCQYIEIRRENIYPQPKEMDSIMPQIVARRAHKQIVKCQQIHRAVASIESGYERRRDAIAEARVAYENAINEAV
jgi:hypothetical protein